MSVVERQVRAARRRLWLNRWLRQWALLTALAAGAWAGVVLADRLFALHFPDVILGAALGAAALVGSFVWLVVSGEKDLAAAVAFDEAAGLRERVSTSVALRGRGDEPFAAAVHADAERAAAGLSVGKVLPLRWSRSFSWCAAAVAAAFLSLLLPEFDVLGRKDSQAQASGASPYADQVRSIVSKPVSAISQMASKEEDPELEKQLKDLEASMRMDSPRDPDALRRRAVKGLDQVQSTLQEKLASDRYKTLEEVKKRFSQMGRVDDPQRELGRLVERMAAGDMAGAKKELQDLKQSIEKMARERKLDQRQAEAIRKKLEALGQAMERAGEDQQSKRELQNLGLSEKDIETALDAASKMNRQQLEKLAKEMAKRLKNKNVDAKKLQKLMEKIAQNQAACKMCKKMGQQMQKAGRKLSEGDTEAAQSELSESEEMLSDMEQLEQSLNDLEGKLSMVDEARNELNNGSNDGSGECSACKGKGFLKDGRPCPQCQGTGQDSGPGGKGRGFGERDRAARGDVDFEKKKANVKTRSGTIIGQDYVEGKPLVGKSEVEFREAASAAEVDATDALNRERVPRAYRKGVRNYFDRLGDSFKGPPKADSKKDEKEKPAEASPASGDRK